MSTEPEPQALRRVRRLDSQQQRRVRVGDLEIGGGFVVVAGPCAVEDPDSLEAVVAAVVAAGAHALRGGAFKPRTSPYSFRGLGAEGAQMLGDAGRRHRRPVVSEVMSADQLPALLPHVDMLQIGARNMQNFELLHAVGASDRPVLLKRGFGNTVDEWLSAAEHLLDAGAKDVVLCERGIRSGVDATRFTLDLGAVLIAKERTHLPVLVDPSHAMGRRDFVTSAALAAAVCGADGLLVEVHADPAKAKSDGPQALTPPMFASLMTRLQALLAADGRALA
ncbi:MAG: 3-deoxy-7-phosphoheptulonate synthase [Deltaproteobacteria bacterium]|nr:3-deoxy-7-phosphoheptulonate synthase [Deltaproteobacteria bacterium]